MPNKSLSFLGAFLIGVAFLNVPALAQTPQNDGLEPPKVLDEASRRLLDQELKDVTTDSKQPVDFPNRPSLGSLELAPLPGINERNITGPASMEPSMSPKDLPSEQLLGRISTEVFQEMADLERGNVFLKLQTQKEQMKNDLEKLKATYRQSRLDEISKREDVVRSRIAWWQEQEKVRLEAEKKKEEAAALDQKIAEAETLREQLRSDALEKAQNSESGKPEINLDPMKTTGIFSDAYMLMSIKGTRGILSAQLKDLSDDSILTVSVNDILPTGHVVRKITQNAIFVNFGDTESTISLAGQRKAPVSATPGFVPEKPKEDAKK